MSMNGEIPVKTCTHFKNNDKGYKKPGCLCVPLAFQMWEDQNTSRYES